MAWVIAFYLLLLIAGGQSEEDPLAQDLRSLDAMRKGLVTPADKVEERGDELLSTYTADEQQALIHYQLAHVHAQSGQTHPKLVVEHAVKALALPLDSVRRLQLHIYHGDALQLMNRERPADEAVPFPELRREAARVYLEALKEAKQFNLPDERPGLPIPERPLGIPRGEEGPELDEARRKFAEEQRRYINAREETRRVQKLWDNRRVLRGQIADLYARPPAAMAELEELTAKILDEPESAAAFKEAVEQSPRRQVAKAVEKSRDDEDEPTPLTKPKRNWWLITVVNLAILISALVGYRMWRRFMKTDSR